MAMAPYLSEDHKSRVIQQVFNAIQGEPYGTLIYHALSNLNVPLTKDLQSQAFAIARESKNEFNRTHILLALIPHFDDELKGGALSIATEFESEYQRALIFAALADRATEENKRHAFFALINPDQYMNEYERLEALRSLIPYLSEDLVAQALSTVKEFENTSGKVAIITSLAEHMTKREQLSALEEFLQRALENFLVTRQFYK